MNDPELIQTGILVLVGASVFLVLEAAYLTLSRRRSYTRKINRRLKVFEGAESQQDVLVILRRERGLSSDGRFRLPLLWLNRLYMQSGIGMSAGRFALMVAVPAFAVLTALNTISDNWLLAPAGAAATAMLLPLVILSFLRRRRRGRFEAMLPDAVDIMVRSLRAGHPLPVAIAMVGRELPDPIGTEFGMTADELTYGLDLEAAMGNMAARVGQDDLALVVVAITIQSRTGGNLSEILSNLANVLRARFKMRRRIKAVSAEGRFSALGLSTLPFIVFGVLMVFAPHFYGGLWGDPLVTKGLGMALGLITIGNLIMFKMVNFRI